MIKGEPLELGLPCLTYLWRLVIPCLGLLMVDFGLSAKAIEIFLCFSLLSRDIVQSLTALLIIIVTDW